MNADAVIDVVCRSYGEVTGRTVTHDEVMGKSRLGKVVNCRQLIAYILRKHGYLSLEEIGRQLNRNHATIIHAVKATTRRMEAAQIDASIVSMSLEALKAVDAELDIETGHSDGPMAQLWRKERARVRALRTMLDIERGKLAEARRKLADLRAEYVKLAEESEEPDDWTPEQRKALAELRQTHMI